MAENATDILSVADARLQFRAPDNAEENAIIEQNIKSAVDYVQERTGIPLINVTEAKEVFPHEDTGTLLLEGRFIKEVTEIKYWEPTQELRENPSGTVTLTDLGRLNIDSWCADQYPPAAGWPERMAWSPLRVEFTQEFTHESRGYENIKTAVILVAREYYEGRREIANPINLAVNRLIMLWS